MSEMKVVVEMSDAGDGEKSALETKRTADERLDSIDKRLERIERLSTRQLWFN